MDFRENIAYVCEIRAKFCGPLYNEFPVEKKSFRMSSRYIILLQEKKSYW